MLGTLFCPTFVAFFATASDSKSELRNQFEFVLSGIKEMIKVAGDVDHG